MDNFENLGIDKNILETLKAIKITKPTDIQEKTIPIAIEGKDILGSAQTGTGKTFAFLLPLLTRLLKKEINKALIVEPTRELAQQVLNNVNRLLYNNKFIKYVLLIGGEPYEKQIRVLRKKPHIFIGTPGRIIDHINQKNIDLSDCKMLILDETDRMFDMGFYEQLEAIFNVLPNDKQTLMFSATFPKEIEQMATNHLIDPVKIFVQNNQEANVIADNLVQEEVRLKKNEKYQKLVEELKKREGRIIIFVKTKSDVEWLNYKLKEDGFKSGGIHGDMRQRKRETTVQLFRKNVFNILIGTDIIARGLDVPNVMHVINYSIPYVPEDYIHRIGRTARAGAKGWAINFITDEDEKHWQDIQEMLHPELKEERLAKNRNNNRRNNNKNSRFNRFGKNNNRRSFSSRRFNNKFSNNNRFKKDNSNQF